MASVSLSGTVTGRSDRPAVTTKTFPNGDQVASFSLADLEYVYAKPGEEKEPQYYNVEVRGKTAEIVAERLQRGSRVAVHGKLEQRTYQDRKFFDVKFARVIFMDRREESTASKAEQSDMPF